MGKMAEGFHITLTAGNACYYQVDGRTYYRKKSSLTRERILKSTEFEKTRKCASDLGRASRIGSMIYRALPKDISGRWIYRAITGEAASLLYKGKEEQEVIDMLWKKYVTAISSDNEEESLTHIETYRRRKYVNPVPSTRESRLQLRHIFYERWEKQGRPVHYFKRAWGRRSVFKPENMPPEYLMRYAPKWG